MVDKRTPLLIDIADVAGIEVELDEGGALHPMSDAVMIHWRLVLIS